MDVISVAGTLPEMWGHTVNLINWKIYILGGLTKASVSSNAPQQPFHTFVYDTKTRNLLKPACLGPPPAERYGHATALLPSKRTIAVFGGTSLSGHYMNDLFFLDTDTLRWSRPDCTGSLPPARRAHTMVCVGDKLIVFGGEQEGAGLNDVWQLDLHRTPFEWTRHTPMGIVPEPRFGHSATVIGGQSVLFVGGMANGQAVREVWKYNVRSRAFTKAFVGGDALPACAHHVCAVVGGHVVLGGGVSASVALTDMYLLDVGKSKCARMHVPNVPKCEFPAAVGLGRRLFWIGGRDVSGGANVRVFNETKAPLVTYVMMPHAGTVSTGPAPAASAATAAAAPPAAATAAASPPRGEGKHVMFATASSPNLQKQAIVHPRVTGAQKVSSWLGSQHRTVSITDEDGQPRAVAGSPGEEEVRVFDEHTPLSPGAQVIKHAPDVPKPKPPDDPRVRQLSRKVSTLEDKVKAAEKRAEEAEKRAADAQAAADSAAKERDSTSAATRAQEAEAARDQAQRLLEAAKKRAQEERKALSESKRKVAALEKKVKKLEKKKKQSLLDDDDETPAAAVAMAAPGVLSEAESAALRERLKAAEQERANTQIEINKLIADGIRQEEEQQARIETMRVEREQLQIRIEHLEAKVAASGGCGGGGGGAGSGGAASPTSDGWVQMTEAGTGKVYFFNKELNQTLWKLPEDVLAAREAAAARRAQGTDDASARKALADAKRLKAEAEEMMEMFETMEGELDVAKALNVSLRVELEVLREKQQARSAAETRAAPADREQASAADGDSKEVYEYMQAQLKEAQTQRDAALAELDAQKEGGAESAQRAAAAAVEAAANSEALQEQVELAAALQVQVDTLRGEAAQVESLKTALQNEVEENSTATAALAKAEARIAELEAGGGDGEAVTAQLKAAEEELGMTKSQLKLVSKDLSRTKAEAMSRRAEMMELKDKVAQLEADLAQATQGAQEAAARAEEAAAQAPPAPQTLSVPARRRRASSAARLRNELQETQEHHEKMIERVVEMEEELHRLKVNNKALQEDVDSKTDELAHLHHELDEVRTELAAARGDGDAGAVVEEWVEHTDPNTGKSYYYNPRTGVTSWDRPC